MTHPAYKVKRSEHYVCKDKSGIFYSVNPNHPCVLVYEGPNAEFRARRWFGHRHYQLEKVS